MKKRHLLLLSMLSGLLFSLAWPAGGFPLLLFFAFIPMLRIEEELTASPGRFHTYHGLFYIYPGFFLWNLLTTWWVSNSTLFGGIMAVLFNSLFMTLAFQGYHWTKKRFFGTGRGYFLLVFYYIAFEYLHQDWDLTWSWLNLGSGFSAFPGWVQWYEYTGIFGGAVWVIAANILGYRLLMAFLDGSGRRTIFRKSAWLAAVTGIPLAASLIVFATYREKTDPVETVVVQPNIDPYKEQYSLHPAVVMDRMLSLAAKKVDSNTQLLVCPESAIQEDIWENDDRVSASPSIQTIQQYIGQHPGLSVVTGASTFRRFEPGEPLTETARDGKQLGFFYDAFNTAVFSDSSGRHQLYHKSKLVVGVERMPFPKYLKFLENFALDLGGTIGSLGISRDRTIFHTADPKLKLGTAICYESVYGEFFSRFVRNGATLMLIITNDGWWGNTPGHRQHAAFAALRAIENRRCIVRSANTGISGFIDQAGRFHQATPYWEPAVIKGMPNLNTKLTFYTRTGDLIGTVSAWTALLLILVTLLQRLFPSLFRKFTSGVRG